MWEGGLNFEGVRVAARTRRSPFVASLTRAELPFHTVQAKLVHFRALVRRERLDVVPMELLAQLDLGKGLQAEQCVCLALHVCLVVTFKLEQGTSVLSREHLLVTARNRSRNVDVHAGDERGGRRPNFPTWTRFLKKV